MTKLKVISSVAAALSLSSSGLFAAALVVAFDSGGLDLRDKNGVSLTAGGATVPYDGAIIQLGYFSGATTNDNNFSGSFISLTGEGSANFVSNTPFDTTVGDDFTQGFGPPFNGQFQITLTFDTSTQTALPVPGTILSVRVFDKQSLLAPGLNFMTISNNLWKWKQPGSLTDPSNRVDITFADAAGLRKENRLGAGGLVSTPNGTAVAANEQPQADIPAVAVPEPSSIVLALVGCIGFATARRRK